MRAFSHFRIKWIDLQAYLLEVHKGFVDFTGKSTNKTSDIFGTSLPSDPFLTFSPRHESVVYRLHMSNGATENKRDFTILCII